MTSQTIHTNLHFAKLIARLAHDQNVGRLDVTVHDPVLVQKLQLQRQNKGEACRSSVPLEEFAT